MADPIVGVIWDHLDLVRAEAEVGGLLEQLGGLLVLERRRRRALVNDGACVFDLPSWISGAFFLQRLALRCNGEPALAC
jgi:hypothetical protein